MRVRIPDRARPAGGSDEHLTVVDQRSGWEYDFWAGGVEATRRRRVAIGLRRPHADRRRRPRVGLHRGPLRQPRRDHPRAGAAARPHRPRALPRGRLRLRRRSSTRRTGGAPLRRPHRRPREGTRFQLDMTDAEIRGARRAALEAGDPAGHGPLRHVRGRHGGSPWDLEFESGSTYTSFGYPDPMRGYRRASGASAPSADGRYHFELAEGHRLAQPPAGGGPLRDRADLLVERPRQHARRATATGERSVAETSSGGGRAAGSRGTPPLAASSAAGPRVDAR